jgi:hypothetical protein
LRDVAKVLRSNLGLSEKQIYIYRSQFDENDTLKIKMETCELETQSLKEDEVRLMASSNVGQRILLQNNCAIAIIFISSKNKPSYFRLLTVQKHSCLICSVGFRGHACILPKRFAQMTVTIEPAL